MIHIFVFRGLVHEALEDLTVVVALQPDDMATRSMRGQMYFSVRQYVQVRHIAFR